MTDRRSVDHEIRTLFATAVAPETTDRAIAAARVRLEIAIDRDASRPRTRASSWGRVTRWRPIRIVALAGAIAAAAVVATTIDPRGSGEHSSVLAPNASAAETFAWATDVIEAPAAGAGTGPVFHSVNVTRRGDEVVEVREQWLDTTDKRHRNVAFEVFDGPDTYRLATQDMDGSVERLRSYFHTRDGGWTVNGPLSQLDVVGGSAAHAPPYGGPIGNDTGAKRELDPSAGPYDGEPFRISAIVTVEEGTRRWVARADAAANPDELLAATRAFMSTTWGYFSSIRSPDAEDARRTTAIRQLVHLLQVAPVSVEATRVLYDQLAHFDELRRLEDVRIDGRSVARIQFDALDRRAASMGGSEAADAAYLDAIRSTRLIVLLVDLEDGRVLGTETLDRSKRSTRTTFDRVADIGDDRAVCSALAAAVPCGILDGSHPVAARATAAAQQSDNVVTSRMVGLPLHPSAQYSLDARGRPVPLLPYRELAFD